MPYMVRGTAAGVLAVVVLEVVLEAGGPVHLEPPQYPQPYAVGRQAIPTLTSSMADTNAFAFPSWGTAPQAVGRFTLAG
jgi:hypothetical protein